MRPELDDVLCSEFPMLYAQRNQTEYQTCMCWGFPDDGWFKLIYDLSQQLEWINNQNFGIRIEAAQVKEKFGTLRFYIDIKRDEEAYLGEDPQEPIAYPLFSLIHSLIGDAEGRSAHTCEQCGDTWSAKLRRGRWIRTLCSIHASMYGYSLDDDDDDVIMRHKEEAYNDFLKEQAQEGTS